MTEPKPERETEPEIAAQPGAPASPDLQAVPARQPAPPVHPARLGTVELRGLHAYYGDNHAVRGVDLAFSSDAVTAIIGPSGCGKSTMVRCINRMHEEIPGARAEGEVLLDGIDLYDSAIDVVAVRRSIGMVFQKPNPFPTMSVFDNVAAGLRLTGASRGEIDDRVPRGARRGRAVGGGQGPPRRRRAPASPAASSSGSASRGRSPSTPR